MNGTKKTIYECLIVVEGRGSFPFDMLRYDCCYPYDQVDANRLVREDEPRRIVLVRRAVNDTTGTPERWHSFLWKVVLSTTDPRKARDLADAPF